MIKRDMVIAGSRATKQSHCFKIAWPSARDDGKAGVFQICRDKAGFTLVEMMITMVVFVLVIAAASSVFTGLLTQFKQQSRVAETNIEGAIGLEILRRDLESAGYGLPWVIPTGTSWVAEATVAQATPYNETTVGTTTNAPRAIVSGNNLATTLNSSDYLVIKAINVANNDFCTKWTFLKEGNTTTSWLPARENVNMKNDGVTVNNNVRVVVVSPGSTATNQNTLIVSGNFYTQMTATSNFAPSIGSADNYIIFGVDENTNLSFPFNRADYYVANPGAGSMPIGCAPNTGILYKATVNHANGGFFRLPLLNCVADMQVIYLLDMDDNGTGCTRSDANGTNSDTAPGCGPETMNGTIPTTLGNAANLRSRLKEIRVYILAHEGQIDRSYTYQTPTITVGDTAALGQLFDLTTISATEGRNYRWKVYSLIIRPHNLR